jgi:hypothetical protein
MPRSHRYLGGVHCSQKTKHVEILAPMSAAMTTQIMTLCNLRWMIRSRNSPSDHFATAIPMTANVCPMASKRIAFERSLGSSVDALWPKPYSAAIVMKMV